MADGAEECPTCGMAVTVDAALVPMSATPAQSVFEPGPSFNEHPAAAADGHELPGWLQSFGGATEEPEPGSMSKLDEHSLSAAEQPLTSELPTWLAAPRTDVAGAPAAAWNLGDGKFGNADESSFISEDDLPDWLRSIGEDSSPEEAHPAVGQPNGTIATKTRELLIPAVVSSWVTGRETVTPAAGESLFAHIASQEQHEMNASQQESDDQAPIAALPEHPFATSMEAVAPTAATQRSASSRRYLLYAAIALVILLVILLIQR